MRPTTARKLLRVKKERLRVLSGPELAGAAGGKREEAFLQVPKEPATTSY